MFTVDKRFNKRLNYLLVVILLFLLATSCGRKMNPTLADYLEPTPVEKLSLSATYDRILISWNYPEREKAKIQSFLIERETNGEKKKLGYFDKNTTSFEDRDFKLGETYKYSIFAIRPKGIYSKPTEAEITVQRLSEPENIKYKINDQGVILFWDSINSVSYNIYRIDKNGKKMKTGSTEKNFFIDELSYQQLDSIVDMTKKELIYLITTSISYSNIHLESKGKEIRIPLIAFEPSIPEDVFWGVTEQGVYITWRETTEKWIKGYKVYRKNLLSDDFMLIGQTMIPLFLDSEYKTGNIKYPVIYKITTEGPLIESKPIEIKVEVPSG